MRTVDNSSFLNKSIIDYICMCIDSDDLAPLDDMGLAKEDVRLIRDLKQSDITQLYLTKAHFLDIKIDRKRFHNLMKSLANNRKLEDGIDKLIAAGAPQPMLGSLFGVTAPQFTARRKFFQMTDEVSGRIADPTTEEETNAYNYLKSTGKSYTELSPEDWIVFHQKTELSLRTIWIVVFRMISEEEQKKCAL